MTRTVTTRHGRKAHAAFVDAATADFLDRFGSAPSIELACGRHVAIAKHHPDPDPRHACTQCARKETP